MRGGAGSPGTGWLRRGRLGHGHRAEAELRHAARHRAMPERRILEPIDQNARLLGGIDMGHHDAERTTVEGARRKRVVLRRHAHQRRNPG